MASLTADRPGSAMSPLPIDSYIPRILQAVENHRAVVVTAAPAAGKTTRVPPALVAAGPVILLEPRRVAARAIARRIALEQGWTVGGEIGWQVRFERQASAQTQLLVATEGVLTAILQHDPLGQAFRTIVLDEFHERSLHADLGLAFCRQAWRVRDDLRLVVMSATMDTMQVSAFLEGCPIIDVPGRVYPIEVAYRPGIEADQAVAEAWRHASASTLCFLPGAGEIRRTADRLRQRLGTTVPILPLHGGLSSEEQDATLQPSEGRRVILATNLAETSVTVPDVTCVVDSGTHKLARYDPTRAIDSLVTERVSQDSADQRAGRGGRTSPGTAVRLWDQRDRLRPHREAEVARVDLGSAALAIISWGGNPRTFEWFERPAEPAIDAALVLLERLGALDAAGRLTQIGHLLERMPLPPRLARILIAARGSAVASRACAFLSEPGGTVARREACACDLLAAVDQSADLPPHVEAVARDLERVALQALGRQSIAPVSEVEFRRAVLAGYPDRVARRRVAHADGLLLSTGSGARLARESGVVDAEFLVAVEMRGQVGPASEPVVRLATRVERDWLTPTTDEVVCTLDRVAGIVRAKKLTKYGALVIGEQPVVPDPGEASRLLAEAYRQRGPTAADEQLLRRLTFAGLSADFEALVREGVTGCRRLDEVRLERHLPADVSRRLSADAPTSVTLTNGTSVRVDYREGNRPVASVVLQRLFNVAETPRIGPRRTPVTFELLAPNRRPVQVTSDLASFWSTVYPEIRGSLRARYPKHRW